MNTGPLNAAPLNEDATSAGAMSVAVPTMAGTGTRSLRGSGSLARAIPAIAGTGTNAYLHTGTGTLAVASPLYRRQAFGTGSLAVAPRYGQTRFGTGTLAVAPRLSGSALRSIEGAGAIALITLLPSNRTAVSYAVVVDGRVVSVASGPLPDSTTTTSYIDLTGITTPAVGDYFSEICNTFSASEPTIPPGEVVPPYTNITYNTTITIINNYDDDDEAGPTPIAFTVPQLIVFHASGPL